MSRGIMAGTAMPSRSIALSPSKPLSFHEKKLPWRSKFIHIDRRAMNNHNRLFYNYMWMTFDILFRNIIGAMRCA
jgi:hypothetical protein